MKKIISIFLTFLVLVSSSGMAYAQHFCGDYEMMAALTLGKEKLSCGMVAIADDGCDDEKTEEHSCCDNQYTEIITDDNFNASQHDIVIPVNFVAAVALVFVLQVDIEETDTNAAFSVYNPPPLIKDIPVLYETFLI